VLTEATGASARLLGTTANAATANAEQARQELEHFQPY
jgi:hypothetical protein